MKKPYISILEGLKSNKSNKKNEAALGTEVGLPIDKENCEATDASMVSTPTGKITNKILCPECNSDNVNIYDDSTMHCVDCDHKWKPSSEDEEERDHLIDDSTNEIASIFTKYSVSSKFTKTALRDYIYNTFGKKPGVSNDWCIANTGKDRYEVQIGKNSYDVSNFQDIHKVYNEAKRLGYVVESDTNESVFWFGTYTSARTKKVKGIIFKSDSNDFEEAEEDMDNHIREPYTDLVLKGKCPKSGIDDLIQNSGYELVESVKYKVGKRYRTEDEMYFTVKKIHKDGTILVHDEDIDKEYDVEISDLELLHPVEIKESVNESKSSTLDKLNSLEYVRGMSKVKFELIKEYEQVLREFPVGTVLSHKMEAGTEKFTKIEGGNFGWWEHLRMPWKDTIQKTTEFDTAKWLASRGVISRGKIELEK